RRPVVLPDPRHEPVYAIASAAERARRRARRHGAAEPVLGQEGLAGAASTARPDARQALRLRRTARRRRPPLSAERSQPGRALRAGDRGLSLLRSARRGGANRCPHPGTAAEPLFL